MVDSQTASVAFGQLAYNPQCFAVYDNPSVPPGQWDDVGICFPQSHECDRLRLLNMQVLVSFQSNKAVLGSSLFISRLEACSWVSTSADPAFDNTFIYDWPIWDYGSVDPNNSTNYEFLIIVTPITIEMTVLTLASWIHTTMNTVLSPQYILSSLPTNL